MWIRRLFPRSGTSMGIRRLWLILGFRLSIVTLGICIAVHVQQWYLWVPVASTLLFLLAEIPVSRQEKRQL